MNSNGEKKYPISETFVSPQGEGIYQGAVMAFLRLAGCTVGKPFPADRYKGFGNLPIYTEACTLFDGRVFECDTDYRVKERLTVTELVTRIPDNVHRVCITGGEPCMHDLSPLLTSLFGKGKFIHIETSGTILFDLEPIWVTVSPKKNYLPAMIDRANELKLLVDKDFNPDTFADIAEKKPVFLHPVNYENEVNVENLQLCMDLQKEYPQYRVGIQLHKAISMLTQVHVR